MDIARNIIQIKSGLPPKVRLVAVSKTQPDEAIMEAYSAGQRIFGENKVQELVRKFEALPKDIEWHFIGHLQTNKVKYIAPFVSLIHSADSLKLMHSINKEAHKINRVINCLLQVKIAAEETKFGMDIGDALQLPALPAFQELKNIRLCGVMGMATFTDDHEQVSREFSSLARFFRQIKDLHFPDDPVFSEISMGMSDDYHIAIDEGSTMVRVGSSIFGERNYN